MNDPINIINPTFRIISTQPSSLGTFDFYLVIFDEETFLKDEAKSVDMWFKENEHEIAESIYDDDFEYPIYVVHSTTTWGETINPLVENNLDQYQFSKNRINCDSVLVHHCLATKKIDNSLEIKTGFHEWQVSENPDTEAPTSWASMDKIYDGKYHHLLVTSDKFWPRYSLVLQSWFSLSIFNK